MYQQEERDDFAKETEKEQLERWKESQQKVESCKSVQGSVPLNQGMSSKRDMKYCFRYESNSSQFQQKYMVGLGSRTVWIEAGR